MGISYLAMEKNGILRVRLSFAFASPIGVGPTSASTIYVPGDYAKIQWAIDNTTAGDLIVVRDGIYYENLVVEQTSKNKI